MKLDFIKNLISLGSRKQHEKPVLLEPHNFVNIKNKQYINFDLKEIKDNNQDKDVDFIVKNLIQNLKSNKNGIVKVNLTLPELEEVILFTDNTFSLLMNNINSSFSDEKEISQEEVENILKNKLETI
jgi:hypothetical protein